MAEERAKVGKKGVMAKRAAIGKTCKDVQKAARDISQEGQRRMSAGIKEKARGMEEAVKKIETGVAELQSAIQAQIKENEDAVAKIGDGTRAVLREAKKLSGEFKRYLKEDFSNSIRDFWYG